MSTPVTNKKQSVVSQKDLNFLIRLVKNNWWVPVVIMPFFYAAAALYVYRLTNVYKTSTEFLLKTDEAYYKSNVVNDQSFYGLSSYIDNSNETRIVKSYDLTSKVVDKLLARLQVSYFIVGKVRTVEYFEGMPFQVQVSNVNPEFYERLLDFRILSFDEYEISYNRGGRTQTKRGAFDKPYADTDLSIEIRRLSNFTPVTVQSFKDIFYQFSIHSRDQLINTIRANLSVENPEYTQILKVNLNDVLPERARLILDTLNSVYSENKLRMKFELNERTVSYIEKQLNEITFSLRSIEDTMQNYKEKRSIINLEWQQTDFLGKISSYDTQKSQLQLQLRALNDLEKYIIEDRDPQFLPPSVFVVEKSGFMTTAVLDLYNKQIELNKVYGVLREDNPQIAELKSSIRKTKQDLLVYITNTRKATLQQITSLEKEIVEYVGEAKLIPSKQRDILNIQRQANVNEQLYNFLLEKRASTRIARASIVPDIKIVESPRTVGIASPDRGKIEKQFYLAGLVICVLIIIIRTAFFTKIRTVEHLRDLTKLPLVGVLPQIKNAENEDIVVEQQPNSLVAESFRNLRTNLMYANIDVQSKTYLVTSFLPGEGKTFTSINLATVFAKSGKKTVIIELDLHKPRIYKRFSTSMPTQGVTTYITGGNTFEEIITETPIPNLYCIFSGPVPPNPSDFVLSAKMKDLLERAKQEFDFVIIDTPPAGLLSDSVYLIQEVDAALFVLNANSSTKRVVSFLEEIVQVNKFDNLLLVLNGVARLGKRYYYQGYGYSYGYGYGYGYGKTYRK